MRIPVGVLRGGAVVLGLAGVAAGVAAGRPGADLPQIGAIESDYERLARPVIRAHCLECHSSEVAEAGLDLEWFESIDDLRAEATTWAKVVEMLDTGEMPPEGSAPVPPAELDQLKGWIARLLDVEARANAGDPGPVVLRRLNNVQYTHTLHDLTGLDLDVAREFPVDSAAGEGFTNTGNALVMSPSLLTKYFEAAKAVAEHAVFLPDSLRFSPGTSRRDWTDEAVARIRAFYGRFTDTSEGTQVNLQGVVFATNEGGLLPLERYLAALLGEREAIRAGTRSPADLAADRGLSPKYLALLWDALEGGGSEPSLLLDPLRAAWRTAGVDDAAALAAGIAPWQQALWRFNSVGHIGKVGGPYAWMEPVTPLVARQEIRVPFPAAPGAEGDEVTLYLAATDAGDGPEHDVAVWENPRLVTPGRPDLPLRDVRAVVERLSARRAEVLADAAKSLDAAAEALHASQPVDVGEIAGRAGIAPDVLAAWFEYLGIGSGPPAIPSGSLLAGPLADVGGYDFVRGWGAAETPNVIANASDQHVRVPGNLRPHGVAMHPSPGLRVAGGWRSPIAGDVRVAATVQHAHPECGNGVSWRLELRRGGTRRRLAAGLAHGSTPVAVGPFDALPVQPGDLVTLSIGPRDANHACDLTAVDMAIAGEDRSWDLAADLSPDITAGNPHADRLGHPDVWHLFTEPEGEAGTPLDTVIPEGSLLARWQDAGDLDAAHQLAAEIQRLIADGPSADRDSPDAALHRQLTSLRGPLLSRLGAAATADGPRLATSPPGDEPAVGLDPTRLGRDLDGRPIDPASLCVRAPSLVEVRLPAELVAGSEFVATGTLLAAREPAGSVQFHAATTPPEPGSTGPRAGVPIVTAAGSHTESRLAAEIDAFRILFPPALCYTRIVPVDEVVTLTLHYREDDHLARLMLDDRQAEELDRLWAELRFVSQDAIQLVDAFQQLMEYATQDADPSVFAPLGEPIERGAAEFREALRAAEPGQLDALVEFAGLAYRRPLADGEAAELRALYRSLRDEDLTHDEALRLTLARVFVVPAFLYRVEQAGPGAGSSPVTGWELASRLSYFLWSTLPDDALRARAAAGDLADPDVLVNEARRMLRDDRVRRLAEEFACQWLQVGDFPTLDEKSERHFPTFAALRPAMYEETVRFFADLFQNDGNVLEILDADHTFLNEELARHYGIDGVSGPEWRRVDGVKRQGRGGILGLATTLARQSGASRTSPILRGNWTSEVVLGERLPRPPKDVPLLPEDEAATEGLTVRQLVERHTRDARCSGCHARIDPFGFALEGYDAIGRLRAVDLADRPIDTGSRLPDGAEIEGLDGLRTYLLTTRRDAFVRQFCRKLLGFALGRGVQLSDGPLLDEMRTRLESDDYRLATAIETIVRSRQFREIRGQDVASAD